MSYGHTTILDISNGVNSDTLTWQNDGTYRWLGSTYYLKLATPNGTPQMTRWEIKLITNNTIIQFSDSFEYTQVGTSSNSPTQQNFYAWTVSEGTAGAQGDPHIKPLFGKDYTI